MLHSFAFWLSVVAVLIAYLSFSVMRRWLKEEAIRRAAEVKPPGTAFDASQIAPQIQCVRQTHLAIVQSRPQSTAYHAGLIAIARRMVASLPYFRHVHDESVSQTHSG